MTFFWALVAIVSMSGLVASYGSTTSVSPNWSLDCNLADLDPKLFYLRRDRNYDSLGDYGHYLRNGGGELINLLDDVEIGIVAGITSVVEGIPVSPWSSSTSRGSINFNVSFRFFTNRHGMQRYKKTIGK